MARGVKGTAGVVCTTPGCENPPQTDNQAPSGFRSRCAECLSQSLVAYRKRVKERNTGEPEFEVAIDLPSELPPIDELRAQRRREWIRKQAAHEARRMIPVDVFTEGPIALAVFGDLHIDDAGTNFPLIEQYTELVATTPGMFAASVGDLQNSWIGRLAHLWGTQQTTKMEAWALVEWWVAALDGKLLFLNNGNHDAWAYTVNSIDPLEWIKGQQTVIGRTGVRMQLRLPNGMTFNINCRHDFQGRSELNPAFGVSKATRLAGHIDDIALGGHIHTAGYAPMKNPVTGKVCHPTRIASFKQIDSYAEESGFPDHNISECMTFIFDINCPDPRHRITLDFNPLRAARVLAMLRAEHDAMQAPPVAKKKKAA